METPNLKYIKEISGGDVAFEKVVLESLKLEFYEEYAILNENFKNKKFIEVALNIHKIKHKIGMLGMKKSFALVSKIEEDFNKGITEQYAALLLILDRIGVYLDHN